MNKVKISSENRIINIVGFQIVWWGMVLYKTPAIIIGMCFLLFHFYFLNSPRKIEFRFIGITASIGFLVDGVLHYLGVINFYPSGDYFLWPPVWLFVLWMSFCSTLRHSLGWIFQRRIIYIPAGGIGGALTYYSAEKLGALELMPPIGISLIILVVVWSFLFVVFAKVKS